MPGGKDRKGRDPSDVAPSPVNEPFQAVEEEARASYGRLLAFLVTRSADLAEAEDALSTALLRALERWPKAGVPDKPDRWLLTVARNAMRDRFRRDAVADAAQTTLTLLLETKEQDVTDRRLQLMFACAHPAIEEGMRTPLILQAVLGLRVDAIARAYMVTSAAMAKRLTRARNKLRLSGIAFELPPQDVWQPRLGHVLDAIYAAYGRSWDLGVAADADVRDLRHEALFLSELVTVHLPDEPAALGLLSLLCYCDARANTRRASDGTFVPLSEQDPHQWDSLRLEQAQYNLRRASRSAQLGRFQLEAAIQSCHVARLRDGRDCDRELLTLYRLLCHHFPTVGGHLAWCAATARIEGPEPALARLGRLSEHALESHQPYWAVRADLERRAHRPTADASYARAIALTVEPAVRRWLNRARNAEAHDR